MEWLKRLLRKWLATDSTHSWEIKSKPLSFEAAIAETVERSRQGDQNAMAMLVAVREGAKSGNPTAKRSYKEMLRYVKHNPPKMVTTFGYELARTAETDRLAEELEAAFGQDYSSIVPNVALEVAGKSVNKAIVTLANGPKLDANTVISVRGTLPTDEARQAFNMGLKYCEEALKTAKTMPTDPEIRRAVMLGFLMGSARKIQAARLPNIPVSILCPVIGWELGE